MRRSYRDVPPEAIELYRKGVPLAEVGARLGWSAPPVAKYLRSQDVEILGRGQKHTPRPDAQELRALRAQDWSAAEIGAHYGMSDEWARERMAHFEIERLPGKARPERNAFWNGGRTTDRDGYVLAKVNHHPRANHLGYVREHRLVMEAHLGRVLEPGEVVDHQNGIVDDNRIENLALYASNADHLRATLTGRRGQRRSESRRRSRRGGPTLSASETGADPLRGSHPLGPWPHGTAALAPSGSSAQP